VTPGELRARLRPIATNERDRFCGVKSGSTAPTLSVRRVDGANVARFSGFMNCGHIWNCPVCSRVLRAKRAVNVEAAVKGLGGRWTMLTATFRHRERRPLAQQVKGLMAAWRAMHQGGKVEDLWSSHVTASVRATEVTHGTRHGWHPHIHALLRSDMWPRADREVLQARWSRAVIEHLGPEATPTARRGLWWSPSFDASIASGFYLTKLGLEIVGSGKSGRGREHRSQWELAADAAEGRDRRDVALWHEFIDGTKGRQMIRLDDRAKAAAREWLEAQREARDLVDGDGDLVEGETFDSRPREVALWDVDVAALAKLRHAEAHHPSLLDDVLRDAEATGDPEAAVRRWVSWAETAVPGETWRPSTVDRYAEPA
jgi:hypothetical protein